MEAVGQAYRADGVEPEQVDVVGPFGNLGIEVALNLNGDGVGGVGKVRALCLRLIEAGPATHAHLHFGISDEGYAGFERNRPVTMAAGDIAPTSLERECRLVRVQAEESVSDDWS